jgi:hypothetical protein
MLNNTMTGRLLAAACMLAMVGCGTPLPVYTPAPAEKTVTAKLLGSGSPYMCTQGKKYSLDVKESGGFRTVQLPLDNRVTLWRYMSFQGYQVISSCTPMLSLVPKSGTDLIISAGLADGRCFIEAVREDNARATGVALDPTVGPPSC